MRTWPDPALASTDDDVRVMRSILSQSHSITQPDAVQLLARLDITEARVAALEAALRRYGHHDDSCLAPSEECICDFDHARALLSPVEDTA